MIRTDTTDLEALADLLVNRTRTILWVALLGGLAFTAVEVVLAPRLAGPFVVKCIGLSLTTAGLLIVRGPGAVRHAQAVSFVVVCAAYLLTALSGVVSPSREYATTAIIFVGATLATATLLPWGAGLQSATVSFAVALLAAAVFRAGGDMHVFSDDPAVAVLLGLGLSVVTAYEMQRHRLMSMRELAARQRAEHELRALNADLERRVAARTGELQDTNARLQALSARLESIREEERARIAHEVHDELGQLLTALKIELDLLPRQIDAVAAPDAARAVQQKLSAMSQLAHDMIHSVRRIATELRPSLLDDLGLTAAIAWQAREFQSRCGVRCTFTWEPPAVALDPTRSTALFRITQEALTNVARHAQASEVVITLREQHDCTVLEVRDDGRGIPLAELRSAQSLGLLGISERARLLGGAADFDSAPGHGTAVRVRIPRAAAESRSVMS